MKFAKRAATDGFRLSRRVGCVVAIVLVAMSPPDTSVAGASPSSDPSGPAATCPDVEVVFARGTFEDPGVGTVGQAFTDALRDRLHGQTVEVYGVDYPASLNFEEVSIGVADAAHKIEGLSASCPSTRIVLGGYSQGAAVAAYTTTDTLPPNVPVPDGLTGPVPSIVSEHVAALALFGLPDAWIMGLVAQGAPPIVIGERYRSKMIELCAPGDPVCFPGGLDRGAHSAYVTNGMTKQAADFVADRVMARSMS